MGDALIHRGPDGEGMHVDDGRPSVGLMSRRLAVIDVRQGAQPMAARRLHDRLQRRGLRRRRAALRARGGRPPLPRGMRQRGHPARLRRVGRGRARAAQRHVGARDLGRPARRLFLARDRSGSSRSSRRRRTTADVRRGDQGARRNRLVPRRAGLRRAAALPVVVCGAGAADVVAACGGCRPATR